MYILNLFGEGIRYWICDLRNPKLNALIKYQQETKTPWNNLVLDLTILNRFGIEHWSELSTKPENKCFILSRQNRMEIKKGARFLIKCSSDELYNHQTLFPKFMTQIEGGHALSEHELIIMQYETGLIGKYRIDIENMVLDDLSFVLNRYLLNGEDLVLSAIKCNDQIISLLNDDTVIRGVDVYTRESSI